MAQPNHNTEDLTVYQMVLNRLPFLVDTSSNIKLASHFTLEVMNELELCFRVRFVPDVESIDFSRIGNELYYNVLQKSIIADIVAMHILMLRALETSAGDGSEGSTGSTPTFMSKVKAGSVEVEYDQLKLKDSTLLAMGTDDLMSMFKNNAIRKAISLGCTIDITDEGSIILAETQANSTDLMPFVVRNWEGGGCCGG